MSVTENYVKAWRRGNVKTWRRGGVKTIITENLEYQILNYEL